MKLPTWFPRALVIANLVVLAAIVFFGLDAYVRWRVGQGISGYHANVITPMVTPRPAQPPPK